MSPLRDAIQCARDTQAYPALPTERLLASERSAAALEGRRAGAIRSAALLDASDPASLGEADLVRLIDPVWADGARVRLALAVTEVALGRRRRSLDRAVIHAYLLRYPRTHPAFEVLRAAAGVAAARHDWGWADRVALWAADAPAALAARLATDAGLTGLGLRGTLRTGAFARTALSDPPSAS